MAKPKENNFCLPLIPFNQNSEVPVTVTNPEESLNKFNPEAYCRTCANVDSCLVPIFRGEGLDHELNKKIEKYLPIQISLEDGLPVQLCYHCASTIIAWDTLIIGCIEADRKLKELKSSLEDDGKVIVKDEEEISTGDCHLSDNMDSDDEPLITKKFANRKGVKRKTAKKREILQEKTDEQKETKTEINESKRSPKKGRSCPICGKSVARFLDRHIKMHQEEEPVKYQCPICRRAFENTEEFSEDLYSHLSDDVKIKTDSPGNCKVCNQKFEEFELLTGHILLHIDSKKSVPERPVAKKKKREKEFSKSTCEICGKTISRKYTMKRHLATHSGEKRFTCHHCGKQYAQESGLQRHVLVIHEGVRKYKCPICSNVFGSNSELKAHQDTHTDPRPFQCDQCGRTFISQKHLYHHRKYHHTANGLRQLCKLCNRYFSSPSVLKRHHKVVHLGLKEFQCHVCSAQLSTKQYLQEHLRIHTDERPEVCSYCGKTFQMAGNLRQHMKTHMEKTQICYVCGKGFTRRCHLLTHMGSHKGLEQPQCEHCNQVFLLKSDLEKHLKNEHNYKEVDYNSKEIQLEVFKEILVP